MAADGLITRESRFTAAETLARLEGEITARGMSVFARVDHAAGAAAAGLALRPTTVVLFGNAKAGTPLMQESQTIGIDLPLKALVFEDEAGKVWLAYNDPRWLAARHRLGAGVDKILDTMAAALDALATKATAP